MQSAVHETRILDIKENPDLIFANGAKHPRYASNPLRLATFADWPAALPQRPEDMSSAGFFYLGIGDHVQCFYCDSGLKNWEAENDPYEEHARWFGDKCSFILCILGPEAVENFARNTLAQEPFEIQTDDVEAPHETSEDVMEQEGQADVLLLEEENELLKQSLSCKVCWDTALEVTFEPCHHFVTCVDCAASVRICPVCRTEINAFVKPNCSFF